MVQARQFRKSYEDSHYAAAVFRYQRELAVRFRSDAIFMCMDDKHRIKVNPSTQLLPLIEVDVSLSVLVRLLRLQTTTLQSWDNSISDFRCRHT